MPTIKPIETVYKGYRFRSRLEARWAVFFDTLGVRWEYEKEGYDLGPAGWYLPDFWLPDLEMWAEVKAEPFTDVELAKATALATSTRHQVLKLIGVPAYIVYWAVDPLPCDWRCAPGCEIDMPAETRTANLNCASCDGQSDYILDDQYCHTEHRWFSSPGLRDGEDASSSFYMSPRTREAYAAARGVRFEHGETPR